uniref:E3 ubiquitin/ISG15 ligase TRIM25-like n=1 Tax=Oryzias melastigma TaxID=30732 RepID=A0A3B3C5K4_ORYME
WKGEIVSDAGADTSAAGRKSLIRQTAKGQGHQGTMSSSKPEETLAQELSCPICLQLYRDPVVLPCGHNYCRVCISKSSDAIDGNSKVLPRNFKLYDPSPAVKTCLKCEVSLCSRHLQKHQEKESFRNHSIVEPQGEMCVKTCAIHSCPLEYFCSNDMTSLCAKCFVEGHHQNHDVLTFSVAEEEMRRALGSRTKVSYTKIGLSAKGNTVKSFKNKTRDRMICALLGIQRSKVFRKDNS